MAIEGTIPFGGTIAVTAVTDTYSILGTEYTRGGLKSVANEEAMLAITPERRELGMKVFRHDTLQYYVLKTGLTNDDFEIDISEITEVDGGTF